MLTIKSDTIAFAWYSLLKRLKLESDLTEINKGSYEKDDYRLQFESVAIEITKPYYDLIPIMPVGMEALAPTTMEYVESYFENYIIGTKRSENETYTYGERINISLPKVIDNIKKYPFSNQHVISVSRPEDIDISDPPCLREIDFKISKSSVGNSLNMHIYFRSWELWAGFPTNLAGLEMLRQYVAVSTGITENRGKIFAYSSGLHIYGANLKNVQAFLKEDII